MFLLNSRYPLACAPRRWLPNDGALLSRSYEGNLPSSFNIVLSSALVYSTRLPESVCGTVTYSTRYEDFLGSVESVTLRPYGLVVTSRR